MRNRGYIAITSSIIITILILAVVITTSTTGYFARFDILGSLSKDSASAVSEGCIDTALLELALDIDYAGATTTSIENNTCEILAIETSGDEKTIKAKAIDGDVVTNMKVVLNTTDFTIVSWDEVESF